MNAVKVFNGALLGVLAALSTRNSPLALRVLAVGTACLMAMAVSGCAQHVSMVFTPPAPLTPTTRPEELLLALDEAGKAWADEGVEPVWIESIEWTPRETINATCGYAEGVPLLACAHGVRMYVREGLADDPRFIGILTHEFGHSIRFAHGGSGGHLPCDSMPGDALMSDGGNDGLTITERDVGFVLGQ